jgi:hypothetical protein
LYEHRIACAIRIFYDLPIDLVLIPWCRWQLLRSTALTVMVPTVPDFAPVVQKGWEGPVEMNSYKAASAAAAAAMPGIPEHAEVRQA